MKREVSTLSGALLDAAGRPWPNLRASLIRQFTALPSKGTPAADLTERDKLALAMAAGAPTETVMNGTIMTVRTLVPCAVTDRGDGGYVVAVGPIEAPAAPGVSQ